MSDQVNQSQVVPPPDQGQETPTTTTPVTQEQLASELQKLNKYYENKLNAFFRGTQSSNLKFEQRVQQRVSALEGAASKEGVTLTDSQKQQITDQATIEELRTATQSGDQASFTDHGASGNEPDIESDKVNTAADTLIRLSGIKFEDGDPEVTVINNAADTGTPQQYMDAVQEAIRLKKARLANGGSVETQRPPEGGAPGAITGLPNANPIANVRDKDQLWQMAKKQGKIK
jgi:hypothetical protein